MESNQYSLEWNATEIYILEKKMTKMGKESCSDLIEKKSKILCNL